VELNLTIKQRLFCKAYLANGYNATQAAITAGYSENCARQIGAELLSKPYIRAFIDQTMEKIEKKLDITFETKAELLWKCALRCSGDTEFTDFIPTSLISAVAELNKMQGHHAAEKKEVTHDVGNKTADLIKQYEKDF
jgi:phage terminase small subunit